MDVTQLADAQAGVLSRRPALDLGLSAARIKHKVRSGRWCRMFPGVYARFSGEAGDIARVWGAALYSGQGAAVAGRSALWLWKAEDRLRSRVEIVVPHGRGVVAQPGVVVRSTRGLESRVHRASAPPRLRLEEAALDVIATAPNEAQVIDVLVTVVQRRLTTAVRLGAALKNRRRCRWRGLITEVLNDVGGGVRSMLEHEYLVRVE